MIDYTSIKHAVNDFDRRHGDHVSKDGWLLFADGAGREVSPMGVAGEPPADPYERAKRVRFFWQIKLERATEAFRNEKEAMVGYSKVALGQRWASSPHQSVEETVSRLNGLKAAVKECQAKLAEATKAVADATPEWMKRREQDDTSARQAHEAMLAAVRSIEV